MKFTTFDIPCGLGFISFTIAAFLQSTQIGFVAFGGCMLFWAFIKLLGTEEVKKSK